jgi:spermidine synthase
MKRRPSRPLSTSPFAVFPVFPVFPVLPALPTLPVVIPILTLALMAVHAGRARPAHAAKPSEPPACGVENLLAGKLPAQQQDVQGDAALVTDGAGPADGALWDGPAAVQLTTGAATLTYDLGEPRAISAFFLQADANDVYRIAGSMDGAPGSFRPLAEIGSVVERGPGLRVRAIEIAPATVRYLRVGEAAGDGAYSISELAAYCRPPTPFPPALRLLDAPMAAVAVPMVEGPLHLVRRRPEPRVNGFQWALAALIVFLLGREIRNRSVNRRAGEGMGESTGNDGSGSEPDEPTGGPAATAALGKASTSSERFFPLLLVLFMASGCAALIYEIVWFQLLQLVIGSSAVSIGVLLGTFMGGMCVGSLALGRLVSRRRHPLRVYALLELGIGASGILMLAVMPLVERIYVSVVGLGVPGLLLRGIFASLCLLPPTAMMGATLPAAARWVETTPRGISWLGYFYGGNTLGAVVGCLLAGFYLLRVHDMPTASGVAVGLNVLVAAAVLAIAYFTPRTAVSPGGDRRGRAVIGEVEPPPPVQDAVTWVVYATIALSGMTALGAEVIWTRLFTLLLGGTTYTFSIILAVFLIGIGLGSGVGSVVARRSPDPRRALGLAQFLLIFAIAWAAWSVTQALPYWPVDPQISPSTWFQFQVDLVRCLWAILPGACLWGASFPLALAAVASPGEDGGRVVGRVYAANTIGAIVGALGASLVVVAWLGTRQGERILIGLAAASAIVALVPMFKRGSLSPFVTSGGAIWTLVIVELASILSHNVSPVPALLVGHGRDTASWFHSQEQYLYVGEGMNSSLAVSRNADGIISYHNAGKVQASTAPQDMRLQRMLGHLTTLLPDHPRNVLVVACGAGVTAGAASVDPRVEHLTIAEIEPLVPKAASRYFGDYNFNVVTNPKVHVEIDDARHFLNTTREKFDAITSDPFDPWVKGAATLYTKEFWELARRHLNPGGVVTVFVQLYQAGTAAVKSEVATFFQVFPRGIIFGNTVHGAGYDVVLVGQSDDAAIDVDAMQDRIASPEFAVLAKSLRQIGFNSAVSLLSTYGSRGPDLAPWLRDAEINRDRDLRLQFLAGFDMNANEAAQIYRGILPFRRYPNDLFKGSPERLQALRTAMAGRPP